LGTQPGKLNNSQTIARNSFWLSLELLFGFIGAFFTSVVVARVMGPQRLGYFSYVLLLTNLTTTIAMFGLPGTVRKYMAEYLSRGQPEIAHAIYRNALRVQVAIAAAITAIAMAVIFVWGNPEYHLISALLAMSMAPRLIGCIPSQANNAAELLRRNTIPSVCGAIFNVVFTLTALSIGWGLAGVAIGFAGGAAIDALLKLQNVARMLRPVPVAVIPPDLRKRLYAYSGQGLALMTLNLVVWDKSDVFFLKNLNPDISQVTFFTLAFNITERLLTFPHAFAGSLTATMMAQYGRGEEKLRNLTLAGAKYTFLIALPLMIGVASVSPLAVTLYGNKYVPLVPVLAVAATLGIAKSMVVPPSALLQATENQGYLIWVGCTCGALDAALDILLTPKYGAVGAAWANGIAQTAALVAIAWRVRRELRMDLRLGEFGRIAFSGASMAAVVVGLGRLVPGGRIGLVIAVLAGVVVWCVMLRLTGAIDVTDRDRFASMSRALPGRVRPPFMALVNWLSAA